MKTTTIESSCLNFHQLESYSLNTCEMKEKVELYQHISTCELCACAVNGFTAVSFTSAEVDAIHHQIDVKTNAWHANPLTFAQVFIACASVISIFGFYHFAESFSDKKMPVQKTEITAPPILPAVEHPAPVEEILIYSEPLVADSGPVEAEESATNSNAPVEPLTSITPDLLLVPLPNPEVVLERGFNSNVIYIYDLKVTDYNSLYFNYTLKPFEVKHTPANKENKGSSSDLPDSDVPKVIAADKTLKAGLYYFNKGKHEEAIAEFSLLLDYEPDDVNALFYSAVSYYHIGYYRHTIRNLEKVLNAENNVFHPEAKWNLALSYLKAGEKSKAKQLFGEIASERGFYSSRASDKLRSLGSL